jgi:hypothetical protein
MNTEQFRTLGKNQIQSAMRFVATAPRAKPGEQRAEVIVNSVAAMAEMAERLPPQILALLAEHATSAIVAGLLLKHGDAMTTDERAALMLLSAVELARNIKASGGVDAAFLQQFGGSESLGAIFGGLRP